MSPESHNDFIGRPVNTPPQFSYENGVLKLTLPKKEKQGEGKRRLEIQ